MISSTQSPRRSRTALPLLGAILIAAAGASVGCERTDPAQLAIDKANVNLDAQSVAGANPVFSAKQRTGVFNDVVSSLKPIADSGDPSHAAAASLLIARAKSGLGEIAAGEAADVERQFLASATVTRALLSQWSSQHATAESLSRYDPSKDLADLDKEIASKSAEATKLQSDKSAQEAAVAAIRAQSDKSRADAKLQRDREAGIRKTAEGQSQTAREATIIQAVEASRAADAFEKKAAELSAEAAKEAPKADEIANQIERLSAQVDSLKKAKENIQQRATAAREQSAKATTDANAVGATITASLNSLASLRDNASKPAKDAVARYTEAAAGASKSLAGATKEGKTAAQALLGASQQSLGDTLATRVRSLAIYSSVLNAATSAKPAVPGAADLAKRASDVAAELTAARADAETAYEKAHSAYAAAGGSGELQAKLKAVAEALDRLKAERNKPVELPKPKPAETTAEKPADKSGEKPMDKPADAPAEVALTPEQERAVETAARDVLKRAADAMTSGDLAALRDIMDLQSDAEKTAFDATMPLAQAVKKLDDACTAKYTKDFKTLLGETQAPAVKGNPLFQMAGPMLSDAGKVAKILTPDNVSKATVKVLSASKADAMVPGDDDPTHIAKVGEAWKIDPGAEAHNSAGMIGPMLPMLKGLTGSVASIADDITADKFKTPDDMLTALSAKLMAAMNPGAGPGGGGRPKAKPPGDGGPKPAPGG